MKDIGRGVQAEGVIRMNRTFKKILLVVGLKLAEVVGIVVVILVGGAGIGLGIGSLCCDLPSSIYNRTWLVWACFALEVVPLTVIGFCMASAINAMPHWIRSNCDLADKIIQKHERK